MLPSQDLAAIPDFQSGAMENWGLTTYRESALLFDVEKASASSKLGITMTVSHELAHQVQKPTHTSYIVETVSELLHGTHEAVHIV